MTKKQTLEQYLADHPEITACYVRAQQCYDPWTGRPFIRQNFISVAEWRDYVSYELFHDAKVKKAHARTADYYEFEVKVKKKKMAEELKKLLL